MGTFGPWGEDGEDDYERACTAEEAELLEANEAAGAAEDRAGEEQLRDALFEQLRSGLAPSVSPTDRRRTQAQANEAEPAAASP